MYEVPLKDSSGMRPCTLADARKLNLLPSVTNILSIIHKPGLERWKQEQLLLASRTLPKLDGEAEDAFVARVIEDAETQSAQAREKGTRIHDAISYYIKHKQIPTDEPDMLALCEPVYKLIDKCVSHVWHCEDVLNATEYAGRVDLVCRWEEILTVVDYKTQKMKTDSKGQPIPAVWDEWALQLAAYAGCLTPIDDDTPIRLINLIVDVNQPGVFIHEWPDDWQDYYETFQAALNLWKYFKDYEP